MGWLLLCAAAVSDIAAPILTITSLPSDGTPEFIIETDWIAGDDLQFERQIAGGDWSGATVTHHTIASAELVGLPVDFALPVLADGTYNFRCKRNSGAYSNVITSTILVPTGNYIFQGYDNGSNGSDQVDFIINLGAGSPDKVLLFGVGIGSTAGSLDSLVIDPLGANIVLTTPINVPTSTYRVAFFSLPASALSGTKTIRLNTTGLNWIERDLHVWSMTGLTSTTYKNVASSSAGSTINMTADAGDLVFVLAESTAALTWNVSSETPVGQRPTATLPSSADWKISGNYPASSFSITASGNAVQAAVSFA